MNQATQPAFHDLHKGSAPEPRLPARLEVATAAGKRTASVYIDRDQVVVRRTLSGLPLTLSLAPSAFLGVAVRVMPEGDTGILASVELLHEDPDLTVTLLATRDMEKAAAEWQGWAQDLGLAMLMVDTDGSAREIRSQPFGAGFTQRRGRVLTAARRPRFLVRRQPGSAEPQPVIQGREIIART